jgi:hypothetical protein
LVRRDTGYHFRLAVPDDLKPFLGGEVHHSLGKPPRCTQKPAQLAVKVRGLFNGLRGQLMGAELNEQQIQAFIAESIRQALNGDERERWA